MKKRETKTQTGRMCETGCPVLVYVRLRTFLESVIVRELGD